MADETTEIKPVVITQERLNEYSRLFAEDGSDPSTQIADTVARTLSVDYPNLINYGGLRDGTAGWFDTQTTKFEMPDGSMRSLSEMAPNERKLSNEDILRFFVVDEEGRPPEKGTFTKGFLRQILPEGAGFAGAMAGGKAGFAAQAPIPPAGPAAVALKVAIPTVSSIGGFLFGYEAGEAATDAILGSERLILPETMADYKSGKTGATVLPWMFFPYMVGKDVALGGGQLLNNISNLAAKGPLTAAEMAQPGVAKSIATGRGPRIARLTRGVENMLNNTRSAALGAPKTTLALEGLAGYGAVRGRYEAEKNFPGNELVGVGAEIGGSLTPSLFGAFLVQKLPNAKAALKNYYTAFRTDGMSGIRQASTDAQRALAVAEILEQFDIEGYTQEDINRVIASLRDSNIDELLTVDGKTVQLTAGQKSLDPVLLAMQASLERTNKGLGRQRAESNSEAINTLRGIIMTMAATGDKEMIKQAALIQKEVFELGLSEELAVVSDQVLRAAERVGGTSGSNRNVSANLQLVTGNLLEEAREREKKLWSAIPELEISEFKNAAGETIDLPNFITNWQKILPKTPEAAAEYLPKLKNLQAFVNRKAQEFGVGAMAAPIVDLPQAKILDNRMTKIIGTPFEGDLATLKNFIGDLPVEDQIVKLREAAKQQRNPNLTQGDLRRKYAAVLDAEAELLIASEKARLETMQAAQDAISGQPGMGTLTVTEVQDMRSTALNIGRQALAAGDMQTARMAHAFADDLLADLESFPEGASAAYDMARAYSRGLNDTFTRAFAGDILSMDRKGGSRIAPELLHNRLFTGGDDATYLRVEQMNKVGQFAVDQGLASGEQAKASIYGGLEGLLRNARREVMDPETGEINPDKLSRWIASNTGTPDEPKLLDFFPNVREDLQDAVTANNLLNTTLLNNKKAVQDLRGQVTFMDLLPDTPGAVENPALVIARVMSKSSKAPMKSLNNLNRIINVAPDDMKDLARQGLRSGILEWAMTHSGGSAGSFSPRVAYEGLFEKIPGANSNVSITDWAIQNNVMTEKQVEKIKTVLTTMVKMEASAAKNVDFDNFLADTGPMIDFYLRVAGSNMGQRVSGMMGSGSNELIAAGAGSKALRRVYGRVFKEIPAALKGKVIVELFEDPQLLADMLEKPRNDAEALNLAKRLAAKFQELGFGGVATEAGASVGRRSAPFVGSSAAEDEDNYVVPEAQEEVIEESSVRLPTVPTVPTQPVAQPTTAVASATPRVAPPPPPAQTGTVDRARFAAMFPEDRDLIAGIGSLMG